MKRNKIRANFREKNKKGMQSLFLNIFIGVICLVILIFAATKIYGFFQDESNSQKAEENIRLIQAGLQQAKENSAGFAEVYAPTDWWIIAWPYKNMVEKPHLCKNFDYCICICSVGKGIYDSLQKCNENGKCIEAQNEIKTIETRNPSSTTGSAIKSVLDFFGGETVNVPVLIAKPLPRILNITYNENNGYEVVGYQ